jgi:hypothetical protein
MGRRTRGAIGALLVVGIALAMSGAATAQTTGSETFKGTIVASYVSGTREVVGSVVVARGVFISGGRLVESRICPAIRTMSAGMISCSPPAACTW